MPVNFCSLREKGEESDGLRERHSRALAQRCRDLLRIAVRSEVKEQLRQWVDDFEDEAAAMGRLNAPKRAADAETAEG
jgi:hypothetical protein